MEAKEQIVRLSVLVTSEQQKRLRRMADERVCSVSYLARKAFELLLRNVEREGKEPGAP